MEINQLMQQLGLQNTSSGTYTVNGNVQQVTNIDQLAEVLKNLTAGSVFEATILENINNQVTIGLADGQTINAKVKSDITLATGSTYFFQVKSNSGDQISIKPYTQENIQNPTLVNALNQAGVEVNDRNLALVQNMMEEQLPIDKSSLQQMVRIAVEYPQVQTDTVVAMNKFQIPMTEGNISQFENYKADQQSLVNELEHVMEQLPDMMKSTGTSVAEIVDFQKQLIEILSQESQVQETEISLKTQMSQKTQNPDQQVLNEKLNVQDTPLQTQQTEQAQQTSQKMPITENVISENVRPSEEVETSKTVQLQQSPEITDTQEPQIPRDELVKTAESLLTKEDEQKAPLTKLTEFNAFLEEHQSEFSKEDITKLFSTKSFQSLMGKALEQQWLLKPEEVGQDKRIEQLYERLDKELNQIQKLFSQDTKQSSTFSQNIAEVRENIQFINEVNHLYQYVQIPLKFANQNTTGELYIYTNKKHLRDPNGELSAHLHLDMEHLGMTDVLVKMKETHLSTHFVMEKEESFDLVEEHIDELTKRLEQKGYQVDVQVENKEQKTDFVKDFLNQEKPVGRVHRYSIDVRA